MTLKAYTYEESRLEYFKEQKKHWERCLKYWVGVLATDKYPNMDHPQFYVEDKCAECGAKVSYYEDIIQMLEILKGVEGDNNG